MFYVPCPGRRTGHFSLQRYPTNTSTFGLASGIGLGVIFAGIFIMVATILTSYTSTAYHTACTCGLGPWKRPKRPDKKK